MSDKLDARIVQHIELADALKKIKKLRKKNKTLKKKAVATKQKHARKIERLALEDIKEIHTRHAVLQALEDELELEKAKIITRDEIIATQTLQIKRLSMQNETLTKEHAAMKQAESRMREVVEGFTKK